MSSPALTASLSRKQCLSFIPSTSVKTAPCFTGGTGAWEGPAFELAHLVDWKCQAGCSGEGVLEMHEPPPWHSHAHVAARGSVFRTAFGGMLVVLCLSQLSHPRNFAVVAARNLGQRSVATFDLHSECCLFGEDGQIPQMVQAGGDSISLIIVCACVCVCVPQVAEDLRSLILRLYDAHLSSDGRSVGCGIPMC